MNKDTILFDLDGTLSDPKVGITQSFIYALREFGIETTAPDDYVKYIGPPLRETFIQDFGFDTGNVEQVVAVYREYFARQGIFENELYPGVTEMLAALCARGKRLVLATSKAELYADKILEHFGIAEYFTFVAGSQMDGSRSAKDEVIRYGLSRLGGAEPARTIMVGDREHDILGARKCGLESVGVLYGYGGLAELHAAEATHLVGTVAELQTLLAAADMG